MTKHRWNYRGDVNLEYGGWYWREDDADDYVCAVEITPASDMGGPDNVFTIERGSIYMPADPKKRDAALGVIGCRLMLDGDIVNDSVLSEGPISKGTKLHRATLVDAFKAYYGIEADTYAPGETIQIGEADALYAANHHKRHDWPEPTKRLRENHKLRNYVRTEWLGLRR